MGCFPKGLGTGFVVTVKFRRFKTASQVEDFLKRQVALGVSSPEDVAAFLDTLGLKHGELVDNSRWMHKVFGAPEISTAIYEQHITCVVRGRPMFLILANLWMLYFH